MKFNTTNVGSNKTTNRAGGVAYKLSAKETLVQIVTTYLYGEPKYYGEVDKQLNKAVIDVAKEDPEFILKLASYNRNEMYLRTISIYLLVKAANIVECKPFVKKYTSSIIKRADEITEALSCQISVFGKPIPASLKKGIAKSFNDFDEYQFAKYNRDGEVKLKDAILLTHPKEPSVLIKKILDDTLETPKTWETEISGKGSTKENWENVIDNVFWKNDRVNNYMAILRNVNNVDKVGVDDTHFNKVVEAIENKNAVKFSKQLPFRFYSALANTRVSNPFRTKLLAKALDKALTYSVENLPKLKGNTLASADTSGSMSTPVSSKSRITCLDIACLMTAMTDKFSENGVASVFGTGFETVPLTGNILADTKTLSKVNVGWATHGYKVIQYATDNKLSVDRFIIYTDEELYGSSSWRGDGSLQSEFDRYVKTVNKDAMLYVVNLNGYGQSCINTKAKNVVTFSGWSEKILAYISAYEQGMETQIKMIENYSVI